LEHTPPSCPKTPGGSYPFSAEAAAPSAIAAHCREVWSRSGKSSAARSPFRRRRLPGAVGRDLRRLSLIRAEDELSDEAGELGMEGL
jgi:hypothetical protein